MFSTLKRQIRRHHGALQAVAFVVAAGMALASPPDEAPRQTPPNLPGADARPLRQALADWLNDDESAALPVLSALALEGNTAARLILGLIDKTPSLQGPYLQHIDRNQRIALLRAPGGLSGRNWLAESGDHPLAAAWTTLWTVDADIEVVEMFETLGEPLAARRAMTMLAAREHPSLAVLDPVETDPELLYLLWTAANAERRTLIAQQVPEQHPQRALMGDAPDARDLALWLSNADAAAPLSALCGVVCPEDREACQIESYRALNSHNALLTLGTPTEALVSQEAFLASPRGRASVMRRILLATPMRGRRAMLTRLNERAACLGEAMTVENDRYRPRLPTAPASD